MDSVLILSPDHERLQKFLGKIGYSVLAPDDDSPLIDLVSSKVIDIAIVDSEYDLDGVEICNLIRGSEVTKSTPIIFISSDRAKTFAVREAGIEKLEIMESGVSIGSLATKIATNLRLRKIAGASNLSATLAEANSALRDLNARFKRELEQARAIQHSLLPEKLPVSDQYEIAVYYSPLEEVGGDWYFVREGEGGALNVQIADVTGHGLSAAFIGCMTRLAISAANQVAPSMLLKETNRLMAPQLPQGTFVTMASFLYDPSGGSLTFSGAGHPPGFHLDASAKKVTKLASDGFAIGFFDDSVYGSAEVAMQENDIFVILTDGITEAQNRDAAQYGADRVSSILAECPPELGAGAVLDKILHDFSAFCDGRILKDDVTMIVLKRVRCG